VSVVACDVTDREAVAGLLTSIPKEHRLTGVIHTAGIPDVGVIGTLSPDRLAPVFAPKVTAVRHLDALTREITPDLDAFIMFSSVASVFLGAGTGSYAAANAFQDAVAYQRRAAGFPAVALAWGLWEQASGMSAGADDLSKNRLSRRGGALPIGPEEGMGLFDAALGVGQGLVVPAKLDLQTLSADATAGSGVPVLLRGLVRPGRPLARATRDSQLADRLAGLAPAEQEVLLLESVRTHVAMVLGHNTTYHIDVDQGLFEIGLDSLTALELRNRLGELSGAQLSPSFVFDYPTPGMIAAQLRELMCGEQSEHAPVP
jgi:hypothetical protein